MRQPGPSLPGFTSGKPPARSNRAKRTPRLPFLAATCLLLTSVWGQEGPHYKAEAYANLYQVRVTGPDQRIVAGLTQNDFRVLQNGLLRPLSFFQEESSSAVSLVILVDTGATMSREAILTAKEMVFQLIHKLDRGDDILLATFDKDVHFLSPLTADRAELIESLANLYSGGRKGKLSRLATLFAGDSFTGYAVDRTLLELRDLQTKQTVMLLVSAGFGNIGRATLDHLNAAGMDLLAVSFSNRAGDAFNLGGDQQARKNIVRKRGGITFQGEAITGRIEDLRKAIKSHYLIAFEPVPEDVGGNDEDVEFRVDNHPEYTVRFARRTRATDSIYRTR